MLAINNSVVRGIAVPNYSNAYKEQSAMIFIANKYSRIYYQIIAKAKSRTTVNDYSEVHHVIPKSLGGSNEFDNLVRLTYKEHRLCHKLLVKMTTGKDRSKMAYATLYFKVDSSTKKAISAYISEYRKGGKPITDGIKDSYLFKNQEMPDGWYEGFSPTAIKKHGDGNKGKKWITDGDISYQIKNNILPEGFYWGQAEYHKKKNSEALCGEGNPMFGKFGDQHPAFGYKHSEEMLKHLSESKIGSKNPMFGKIPANAKSIEINGVLYKSMAEAKRKTGLSRRTIENLYKGI